MAKDDRERYVGIVERMNDSYVDLLALWEQMDRMTNVDYELPPRLAKLDFMRTWRSTWPADSIVAGAISLSALEPRLRLVPWLTGEEGRRKANDWEKIIKWQMFLAGLRRPNFRADICASSLRYGMIVAPVIHVPTQQKRLAAASSNSLRGRANADQGDWLLPIKNPKHVRTEWSEYGLERVCYIATMTAQEIVDFWGKKAGWLARAIELGTTEATASYVLVDLEDYERRLVWAYPGDDVNTVQTGREIVHRPKTENEPYLNWVAVTAGTELELALADRVQPLLMTLAKSENWLTDNLLRSLKVSEAISEHAQPKVKVMGPNPKAVKDTWGRPGGRWEVPSLHDVQPMPRVGVDQTISDLLNQFAAEMESTTISRVLMNAETLAGETYSGFNMRVQTALGKLTPHRISAESFEAEFARTMMLQAHYGGFEIKGWIKEGTREAEGHWDVIKPEEIDPKRIYLSVRMRADVPTDRQQQVNTALMMAKGLPVGATTVLEELGYDDPEGVMDDFEKDQIRMAIMQARLQRLTAENSGAMEAEIQKRVQEQIAKMMQSKPAGGGFAPPPAGGQVQGLMPDGRMPTSGEGTAPQGVEGSEVLGEGANPAMGGQPVAQMAPEMAQKAAQQALMGAEGGF
jgi:hypothetical protein